MSSFEAIHTNLSKQYECVEKSLGKAIRLKRTKYNKSRNDKKHQLNTSNKVNRLRFFCSTNGPQQQFKYDEMNFDTSAVDHPSMQTTYLAEKVPTRKGCTSLSREKLIELSNRAKIESDLSEKAAILIELTKIGGPLGNKLAAPLMDKATREKMRNVQAQRRQNNVHDFRQRRRKLEEEHIEKIISNSAELRKARIKEMALDERRKLLQTQCLLLLVLLSSRTYKLTQLLSSFRELEKRNRLQDESARLITANIRLYVYRKRRKRIKWATSILCLHFVSKLRRWSFKRKQESCEIILDFLLSVKCINTFHGCMNLLIRGKEWNMYKRRIVIVQRHWRLKKLSISSQVRLLDQQWQDEHDRNVMTDVDSRYFKETDYVTKENILIEAANRTRRLLKMRCLPLLKVEDRAAIKERILGSEEFDVLKDTRGNIPSEIRIKFIRSYLKALKQLFMNDLTTYSTNLARFKNGEERRLQQDAFLNRYGGKTTPSRVHTSSTSKNRSTLRKQNCKRRSSINSKQILVAKNCDLNRWVEPLPPKIQILLHKESLEKLIELSQEYIHKVKEVWKPQSISFDEEIVSNGFIGVAGRTIAKMQYSLTNDNLFHSL